MTTSQINRLSLNTSTSNEHCYKTTILNTISSEDLHDGSLVLASSSEETSEARTKTIGVVANSSSRAIASGLISVSGQRVGSRRALLLVARRTTVASITQATHMLHGVPRSLVHASGLGGKMLLGPASSLVVAVVGADGSLASSTLVTSEALALTGAAVADTLVRALGPGMNIVGVNSGANPSKVKGAGARRAVGAGPLIISVQSSEAFAVAIHLTSSVAGALILAHASLAVSLLGPHILAPGLLHKRR